MGLPRPNASAAGSSRSTRARWALGVACFLGAIAPSLEASIAVASLVSLGAFVASAAWNRGRPLPRSLAAIQVAVGLFAVGSAVRVAEAAAAAGAPVYPGIADLLVVPGYLFTIWGVGRAAMARHALAKIADLVDASAVAVAAATFSLAGSSDYLAAAGSSRLEQVVLVVYFVVEPLLYAVMVLLIFGPGTRSTSAKFLAGAGVYLATFEGVYEIVLQAGYPDVVDQSYRTLAVPMVLYAFATSFEDYPAFAAPGIRPQRLRAGVYSSSLLIVALLAILRPGPVPGAGFAVITVLALLRLSMSTSLLTRLQGVGDAQRAMASALAVSDSTAQALEAAREACGRIVPEGSVIEIRQCVDGAGSGGITSTDGRIRLTSETAWRPHHIAALTQILDLASFGVDAVEARTDRIRAEARADWTALSGAGNEMVFRVRDGMVDAATPNAAYVLGLDPIGEDLQALLGCDLGVLDQRREVVFPTEGGRWMAVMSEPGDADSMIVTVRDATARVRAERIDSVTGLPNMVDFERCSEISNTTVTWHRVEDFSRHNDQLGKAGADALLAEIARRLRAAIRDGIDEVWRGDGPSFVVACAGTSHPVDQVASRLEHITGPIIVDGSLVAVTMTSVVVHVTDPISVGALNHRIELTASQPEAGPGEILVFHPEIEADAQRRYLLEDALRTVTDPGAEGFRVHYQPIMASETLEPARLEALIRWEHPELGRVSPAEFIPAAERVGRSALLDQFVMATAVADQRRFRRLQPALEVQVNLSPVGLTPDRIREITAWTSAHCPNPPRLTIEIIESVIGDGTLDELMGALRDLVATGVGLSVDDFGVGESNLHRVMSLPITQVKLAGLFSTDQTIHPQTIARLIDTIHSMGHAVVVESVETEEQAAMMRTAGADFLQGWLYSRDLPADALVDFLASHQTV